MQPSETTSYPRWALIGLFVYASIGALAYARAFLIPVVLAFLLSLVFGPVRRLFDRLGVPQFVASFLIVASLLALVAALASALSLPLIVGLERLPELQGKLESQLRELSYLFRDVIEASERLRQLTEGSGAMVVQLQGQGIATTTALTAPTVIGQLVFTLALLMFLLASGDMFYEKLVHVMPTATDKARSLQIALAIERKLSRYLLAITIVNAGLGTAVGLAMWAMGMPGPIFWGLLAFFLNFMPYVGAAVGIFASFLVALIAFPGVEWAFVVALVYMALTSIEGNFVMPMFVGKRLRLNGVVVFVAVSFWAWLWSFVGIVVAVPLLIAFKTFCEHIPALQPIGVFLAERDSEEHGEGGRVDPGEVPLE
ncbi:MAG: AI-2E family transporter [Paracoccaceae bacterium]